MTSEANTPGLLPDVPGYIVQIIHLWIAEGGVRILTHRQQPFELLQQHLMRLDPRRQNLMKKLFNEASIAQILSGQHVPITKQLMAERETICKRMSQNKCNIVYQGCYIPVLPTIIAFRAKDPHVKEMGEVEILYTILYNATVHGLAQGSDESTTHPPTDIRIYQQISALFTLLDQGYHRKHHQEESQEETRPRAESISSYSELRDSWEEV